MNKVIIEFDDITMKHIENYRNELNVKLDRNVSYSEAASHLITVAAGRWDMDWGKWNRF